MSHCPACGAVVAPLRAPPGTCPSCGTRLGLDAARKAPQRTLLGGIVGSEAAAPPVGAGAPQKTMLGIASPFAESGAARAAPAADARAAALGRTQVSGTPVRMAGAPAYDPVTDPERAVQTIVDIPTFAAAAEMARAAAPPGAEPSQRTLLGVARPGIAPLRPGVAKTPIDDDADPPSYAPIQELGATQLIPDLRGIGPEPQRSAPAPPPSSPGKHPLGQRRFDKMQKLPRVADDRHRRAVDAKAAQKKSARRAIAVVGAGIGLAAVAVIVALAWPSAPPLRAQVRAAEGGAEVIDIVCESCPDGTVLKLREVEGTVAGKRATLGLAAPLAIGDTPLKIAIDRPESGRDEVVTLPVRVAYRVRPDLTTLDGDRPSIQVIVEAMEGSIVSLDGEEVPLREGRAVKTIDVAKDLQGTSADAAAQLSRRVSFVVRPPDGDEEKGVVAVSVPVLPLAIEAPGRAVVTERPTFQLAGRTLPGAEIVVAGRSIGIAKDGAFSQTMNVSSVGATQIEVRARMPGRAPRLARLGVERVTSLETAAEDFAKKGALTFDALKSDLATSAGKPVIVEGEVLEVKLEPPVTIAIVRAASPSCSGGESGCLARLVQGRTDLELQRGAKIRAFGTVVGTIAHDGATVPDIDVAFSIPHGRAARKEERKDDAGTQALERR